MSYQGWQNYETWATALWIDNEQNSYQHRCHLTDIAQEEDLEKDKRIVSLANSLKEWIESANPLAESANLFSDLLQSALSEIDWQEIAENFLAE